MHKSRHHACNTHTQVYSRPGLLQSSCLQSDQIIVVPCEHRLLSWKSAVLVGRATCLQFTLAVRLIAG